MPESNVHKNLKKLGMLWLKSKVIDLVAQEVDFRNIRSIADVAGINLKRKEIRVIECKATKNDFLRDKKLFMDKTTYLNHANYSYILCPKDVINKDEIPKGYGLLYANEFDKIELIVKPNKNNNLKTKFETTLKNTTRAITNELLFKKDNYDNKDETNGKFSRNAIVSLVSALCPKCKYRTRELIKNDKNNNIIKCRHCKEEFETQNVRIITEYNKNFIKKINDLVKE